jgi:hypothetical protein
MRKKEFVTRLCQTLTNFPMVGHPNHNAFPCICGENKLSNKDAEVCAETAEEILTIIKQLVEKKLHASMRVK